MKKIKGIEKGKREKRGSSKKLVMAVIIVSAVMTAFISGAAAAGTVTTFDVTPKTVPVRVSTTGGYDVIVNTTGFENSLTMNITLPKGFSVAYGTMTANAPLATVGIYNTTGLFATVTFEANGTTPQTKVDVDFSVGGDTISTVKTVNYGSGATTAITAAYGSTTNLNAEVILPTAAVSGSVNASITLPTGQNITNVSISIESFVTSPGTVGDYTFVAKVNGTVADAVTSMVTVTSAPTRRLGGGGGGAGVVTPTVNVLVDPTTGAITETTSLTVEKATLTIPEGTIIKDAEGNPLSTSITTLYTPTMAQTVGAIAACDFGPSGTTFAPPIDLVIEYDPAEIPAGFSESDLVIKMYDGTAKSWIDFETTVDTVAHTATAKVSHFTIFALFAAAAAPPPVTPTPTVAPTVPPITPTPPVVPPPAKRPWALIIGIIVAVIIVGAAAYYFYTKKKA